ncbi:EAL domain-containing protein (putative c-di-GMP-specific phosphodiesterase class I) [Geomicrobium halophilum]|uniref:EAL domain-containing protein (Putative c-di-GMP-specific phosphodiesterase class I) n=1 Tax=Geomicrobium halophilum TaxID=549000 RepID=A0A841PN65_9BACL|nr:EAL-associated domain-containing protein [Geomicrobium halophilum]MBB6449194.1 EAL domain-containing protein (putative c-di-GMP-specific phosphodiesterase class I) [Geomicrobium halophilum]
MDALEVMMHKERTYPLFQPIFVAGKHEVVGYEVLPRLRIEEHEYDLTDFFYDSLVPEEYRLEIDRYIRKQALEIQKTRAHMWLFYNINPSLYDGSPGDRLISELAEESTEMILSISLSDETVKWYTLRHFVQFLQNSQIRVAMKETKNAKITMMDIVQVKPDIIKIDIGDVERENVNVHRELLHTFSIAAGKIGASLLFQNIKGFQQLSDAWRQGALYLQGDYLALPHPTMIDNNQEKLVKNFRSFLNYEREKKRASLQFSRFLSERMKKLISGRVVHMDSDTLAQYVGRSLQDICFRVYICDGEGFQLSGNAVKHQSDQWEIYEENRRQNWSWRPFFLENIVQMHVDGGGILSELYMDLHRHEQIRTYSYPAGDGRYIFVDIPFSYLYERDFLG